MTQMNCLNCGNDNAYRMMVRFSIRDGKTECCDKCGAVNDGEAVLPDVYLQRPGQKFANLCDPVGNPYEISSKRHKKQVMDQLGVREAGGTFNGAPYGTKSWIDGTRSYRKKQFEKDRPMIRETLRQWKEKSREK